MANGFLGPLRRVVRLSVLIGMLHPALVNAAEPGDVAAGRRIARENCGECHATGAGRSPLADAPPFRLLYLRYPPEGLDRLLREGMIAQQEPRDEAPAVIHPRMPVRDLDSGQVADLTAYLHSLEPRGRRGRARGQSPAG